MAEETIYREHDAKWVDPTARQLAEAVKKVACRRLGLSPDIRLRWFDELDFFDEAERARGKTLGKTFKHRATVAGFVTRKESGDAWVRAGLPAAETAEVVAHELRHLYQFANWPGLGAMRDSEVESESMERDAVAYAAELIEELGL